MEVFRPAYEQVPCELFFLTGHVPNMFQSLF